MRARTLLFIALLFLLNFAGAIARAEEGFYRVYSWEQPFEGTLEPELWTTYFAKNAEWAGSFELEYGITPAWSVAGYLDFARTEKEESKFGGGRIETRYRFDRRDDHFFDTAIYAEYGVPKSELLREEGLELKLILEKFIEDFGIRLNPGLFKATAGADARRGVEFEYSLGAYYRRFMTLQPGLELYGDLGELSDPDPLSESDHVALAVLQIRFDPEWTWQIGAGPRWGQESGMVMSSLLTYEPQPTIPLR